MNRLIIGMVSIGMLLATFGGGADENHPGADPDNFVVTHRVYNEHGQIASEQGYMKYNPDLSFIRDWTHKPNHGGGGGPPGGGGGDPNTDCSSDAFRKTGHFWTGPYSASASSYANVLNAAAETWDSATGANIFGSINSGAQATAGVQDFVNQMDWTSLGASSTIAVTTTWYYTATGEAVESDAQYNTYYSWSTSGASNAMDVQGIGTHEIGHTFGLDHPSGNPNKISCLTMYAYGANGQTHQRTLGDGDILGIRDLYGA